MTLIDSSTTRTSSFEIINMFQVSTAGWCSTRSEDTFTNHQNHDIPTSLHNTSLILLNIFLTSSSFTSWILRLMFKTNMGSLSTHKSLPFVPTIVFFIFIQFNDQLLSALCSKIICIMTDRHTTKKRLLGRRETLINHKLVTCVSGYES